MHTAKGNMEIQTVITLIIGLVVLLTLIYIFRSNISIFFNTLFDISQDINASRPPIESIVG